MIRVRTFELDGVRLVVMTERDYEALCRSAGSVASAGDLPAFPKADRDGNMPAVEYARVSIARDLIRARRAARLSQQQLAKLAGVRQETLSRIETAKHSATPATLDRIDRAIRTQSVKARSAPTPPRSRLKAPATSRRAR